jgi:hypothetical protein
MVGSQHLVLAPNSVAVTIKVRSVASIATTNRCRARCSSGGAVAERAAPGGQETQRPGRSFRSPAVAMSAAILPIIMAPVTSQSAWMSQDRLRQQNCDYG